MNLQKLHQQLNKSTSRIPFDRSQWPYEWFKIYLKQYSRFESTPLPDTLLEVNATLTETLKARSSRRTTERAPLTKEELGTLLYYSAGINDEIRAFSEASPPEEFNQTKRFYPSAGGRYPIEIYVGIQDHPELDTALYHYNVMHHSLTKLFSAETYQEMLTHAHSAWTRESPTLFLTTAVCYRNVMKYGDRGYSMMLMEAGHVQQNMQLLATALGKASCIASNFDRDAIHELYDWDDQEILLNLIAVG